MDSGSSNLLHFKRSEDAKAPAVVTVALRPDSQPWYLLEHALDWAQRLDARLDLCTVIPAWEAGASTIEFSPRRVRHLRRRRRAVRAWLEDLMRAIPAQSQGDIAILEGEPAPSLLEYAQQHTLLIMGGAKSTSFLPFFRFFVRGVTSLVADTATIPVAIVRGRRLRGNPIAMLPLLPAEPRPEAAQWMAEHLPNSNVKVVHLASREDEPTDPDSPPHSETRLRVLTNHSVGPILARYAKRLDADLVVLPAPVRTGLFQRVFGTALDRLVRDCCCSVLVVPPLV
jgi:nucleotide-binding universal stress UspA family protein